MKRLFTLLIASLLVGAVAHATPATPQSIDKLLTDMQIQNTLIAMQHQVDGMIKQSMDQAMRGQTLPPEAQKLFDGFRGKMSALLKDELSWEKMKDIYTQIYGETFTEEEIQGLIAFYESPAGKAFAAKMPAVTQKSMVVVQQRMGPLMQKIRMAMQETMQEMAALKEKEEAAAPAAPATPQLH